jgi:hypothetical protein
MSDVKLFRVNGSHVEQLDGTSVAVERSLQLLIERHLEIMLGVRLLATEYRTGKTHGGRIDTLGIDENGSPVIIEYKRATNENVINQGLYYLDWLLDHKGEFKLLVLERLSKADADAIAWSSPRLLCIAGDFTKFDEHAVSQINRHIELIRYRRYGYEVDDRRVHDTFRVHCRAPLSMPVFTAHRSRRTPSRRDRWWPRGRLPLRHWRPRASSSPIGWR